MNLKNDNNKTKTDQTTINSQFAGYQYKIDSNKTKKHLVEWRIRIKLIQTVQTTIISQ